MLATQERHWIDKSIENLKNLLKEDRLEELDSDIRADLISQAFEGIGPQEMKTLRNGIFAELCNGSVVSVIDELCTQLALQR